MFLIIVSGVNYALADAAMTNKRTHHVTSASGYTSNYDLLDLEGGLFASHGTAIAGTPSVPRLNSTRQYRLNAPANPMSLDDLLAISPLDLHRCDIARMNLLCATGLPNAHGLDIDRCLATLGKWASRVERETGRHSYRVKDPRFAGHYEHSPAKFCAEMLAQVLQEDCGVRYNPARVLDPDYRNSKDLFLHGMIDDANGGTCVSLPVLYAAVGRRLGYPIRLVHANAHLFCRWEGPEIRFNIEVAGSGCSFFADDYYKTWPIPLSEDQLRNGEFLASLSPAEELAAFLAARAWCLEDNGRVAEAIAAYEAACRLHPGFSSYRSFLRRLTKRSESAACSGLTGKSEQASVSVRACPEAASPTRKGGISNV
jgi:hypothetical protein